MASNEFDINIQSSQNETFKIKYSLYSSKIIKINQNLKVGMLKYFIKNHKSMKFDQKIYLTVNNEEMVDDKILQDYNITDGKHLIRMKIGVEESKLSGNNVTSNTSKIIVLNDEERKLLMKLNEKIQNHTQWEQKLSQYSSNIYTFTGMFESVFDWCLKIYYIYNR